MRAEQWGCLSGNIFFRTGFLVRGKSVWTCPQEMSRANLRPIVKFKAKQTSRWNFQFTAQSLAGDFSFEIKAMNPPLVGFPQYEGFVRKQSQVVAAIASENQASRILSIRATSTPLHITAEKVRPGYGESDILFKEESLGEFATISRRGEKETLREQLESKLGFGLSKRGAFKDLPPQSPPREPITECMLAAVCLYLYSLEPLLNTEYPSG
jgi:hypothetical protein